MNTFRLVPRWFAAMILASVAIVIYGLGQPQTTSLQDNVQAGPANKELYDVLWIDQYPEVQHDKWKAYLYDSGNVGISIDAQSAFKLTIEIFEFKCDKSKLNYHFPHDGRRAGCAYKIEKIKKTKHFDTSLTIENDPQNGGVTKTYFTGPEFRQGASLPESVREVLESHNLMHYLP